MNWYADKAGNDSQGMVVDEETGRTVAVAYDSKDTALLAAAPELLEALKCTLEALENWVELVLAGDEDRDPTYEALQASRARAIIAKAEGEPS